MLKRLGGRDLPANEHTGTFEETLINGKDVERRVVG